MAKIVSISEELENTRRFLVKFPDFSTIFELFVQSVGNPVYHFDGSTYYGEMEIDIKEIYSSNETDWYPDMSDFEMCCSIAELNSLNEDYLVEEIDDTGVCIWKTRFIRPKIISFERGKNNYRLVISFKEKRS